MTPRTKSRLCWWLLFGIVTALTALTMPSRGPQKSSQISSLSNVKQLGLALATYIQDYEEHLPPMQDSSATKAALKEYVGSSAWAVPGKNQTYAVNSALSLRNYADFHNPSEIVAIYEGYPWRRGMRNVGFLDGHGRAIHEKDWLRYKDLSGIISEPSAPHIAPWWAWWRPQPRHDPDEATITTLIIMVYSVFSAIGAWLGAAATGKQKLNLVEEFLARFFGQGLLVTFAALLCGAFIGLLMSG